MNSFWLRDQPQAGRRPALTEDIAADVVVLGGGLVGVSCAYLLAREGRDVVLVEAAGIASGTTGTTTAKVSAAHGLRYAELERRHDEETASAYAALNVAGLEWIDQVRRDEGIGCDWRRRDAITYALDEKREELEAEVGATRRAGLGCELVETTDLPFGVAGAVRVAEQAEFDPVKWTVATAAAAETAGARIFEDSRAMELSHSGDRAVVGVGAGSVTADHVVVATHYPVFDRGLFFAKLSAQRSYCLGIRADGELPGAMYISADAPTRSIRTHPLADGSELLIVGGEGHKAGEEDDTAARYRTLATWAREHFDVRSVDYRWSAQDPVSPDLLPYIGPLTRRADHVLVATGFSKWGLAAGAGAAKLLVDRILGRGLATDVFDSKRIGPVAAGPTLVKENLKVAGHLLGDRFAPAADVERLGSGEGAIVGEGSKRIAAFRDADGALHEHSAACTHLGCELRFNNAEASWDCACHGSRFDASDGSVLEGPAVSRLQRVR